MPPPRYVLEQHRNMAIKLRKQVEEKTKTISTIMTITLFVVLLPKSLDQFTANAMQ